MIFINKKLRDDDICSKILACYKNDINKIVNTKNPVNNKRVNEGDIKISVYKVLEKIENKIKEKKEEYSSYSDRAEKFEKEGLKFSTKNKGKLDNDLVKKEMNILEKKSLLKKDIEALIEREKNMKKKLISISNI